MTPDWLTHMRVKRDKHWSLLTDGVGKDSPYPFLKKLVDKAFEEGYLTAMAYRTHHDEATRLEDSHLLGDIADKNSM